MTIHLRPETAALIAKRIESGAFSTPEEVIERAIELLSSEEDWLAQNRDEIASKIEEGWEQAERGELTDGDDVKAEMERFKADWLKQHQPA